ncbi:MAG: hypothetical protein FWD82_10360 [Defluviitaleaceae bacterium]|nr:hypothetical protein [Defluviitaleaceae bacterium]
MGISKSELMNYYYIDEIAEVFNEYRKINEIAQKESEEAEPVFVDFQTFFC